MPLPAPITLPAACLTVEGQHVLAFDSIPPGQYVAFGPPVYLRFAFAPVIGHDLLIPAGLVEDRGWEIAAPEVYDWIETRGTQYPRADVLGLTPDGRQLNIFLKELDLAARPLAFAAPSPDEFPGLPLSLWLGAPPAEPLLPDWLLTLLERALPRYTPTEAEATASLSEIVAQITGQP